MGAQLLLLLQQAGTGVRLAAGPVCFDTGVRLIAGPVDLAVFQIGQCDLADRWLLVDQRVFSVFAPAIRSADDQSVFEWLAAGCGEEAVDIFFLQTVVGIVELALDGVHLVLLGFGHEVDTVILRVKAGSPGIP